MYKEEITKELLEKSYDDINQTFHRYCLAGQPIRLFNNKEFYKENWCSGQDIIIGFLSNIYNDLDKDRFSVVLTLKQKYVSIQFTKTDNFCFCVITTQDLSSETDESFLHMYTVAWIHRGLSIKDMTCDGMKIKMEEYLELLNILRTSEFFPNKII